MTSIEPDYQTPKRMAAKRQAVPLPDLFGKRVLDVGCDMGAWSLCCADLGASYVLGLDRNREVRDVGKVDLIAHCEQMARATNDHCQFSEINVGKQWHEFGKFDLVLMLSLYHHIYENCGDHLPVWFWLWRHMEPDGELLWENPVDDSDPVVRANVSDRNRKNYTRVNILAAASRYFEMEYIGPALHEPTREVWRFVPKPMHREYSVAIVPGSGGASAAFNHKNGHRIAQIAAVLGIKPVPGSLNLMATMPFDWDENYYRAQIDDVVDRSKGIESEWAPQWARFYPVTMQDCSAVAFRFEGEKYASNFIELIADVRLREHVSGQCLLT